MRKMKVRFCCVVFAQPNHRIAVAGSLDTLGAWDPEKACEMRPYERVENQLVPSLWIVDVELGGTGETGEGAPAFEYKFIRWTENAEAPPCGYTEERPKLPGTRGLCTGEFAVYDYARSQLPSPSSAQSLELREEAFKQSQHLRRGPVEWEGSGSADNRRYSFREEDLLSIAGAAQGKFEIYVIPPSHFIEQGGSYVSEMLHTTRYYTTVRDTLSIHYNQICDKLFCGTTPRVLSHIRHLRDELKATCVMNLQTVGDAIANFPAEDAVGSNEEKTVDAVYELYKRHDLLYVWLPTEDMQTAARGRQAPQAAFLLKGLIEGGHIVYVHCNAGVGRSVMACSAYLVYCMGLKLRQANFIVNSRRPVAFWDEEAIRAGADDYAKKFRAAARTGGYARGGAAS